MQRLVRESSFSLSSPSAVKKANLLVNLKDLDLYQLFQRQIIQAASAHPLIERPIDMKDGHLY